MTAARRAAGPRPQRPAFIKPRTLDYLKLNSLYARCARRCYSLLLLVRGRVGRDYLHSRRLRS